MKLSVPLFSQNDPKWKLIKLGFSDVTLGGYGCLVTCIAMLSKYYGKDTDPDKLNQALKDINGFANQNLYKWYEGAPKIYTDIKCEKITATPKPVTQEQWNEIKAELDAGRPVVLQVDFIPGTSAVDMHFVLLVGHENDKWIVNDPWYGDQANLDRYGKPEVTIQQYIFHQGPIQNVSNQSPELQECLRLHGQLVDEANKKDTRIKELENTRDELSFDLDGLKSEVRSHKDFQTQLASTLNCEDQPTAILGQVVKLISEEDKLTSYVKKTQDQSSRIKELETQHEAVQLTIQESNTKISELSRELQKNIEARQQLEIDLAACKTSQRYRRLFTIFRLHICEEVKHI